ncbi:MAG: hypothetical protein PHU22_04125 [Eubacteriales bacterium]|nr:hypothetical protein [Eubacteriales bacterium]
MGVLIFLLVLFSLYLALSYGDFKKAETNYNMQVFENSESWKPVRETY